MYFLFVACLCVIYALINADLIVINKINFLPAMFMLAWTSYSFLSYNWSFVKQVSVVHSILILKKAMLFIIVSIFCRHQTVKKYAPWFWFSVILVYIAIALWEMLTWQHLPQSLYYNKTNFVPTGPFYGPNQLAAAFNLLLPFILFLPEIKKSKFWGVISLLCFFTIMGIIVIEGARIAIIACSCLFLFAFIFLYSARMRRLSLFLMVLIIVGLVIFAKPLVSFGTEMFTEEISSIGQESKSFTMSSIKIRTRLIPQNLEILAESGFKGVGAGNVEHYMLAGRMYKTGGISNSHNFFLELLTNYGIVFFLGFAYLYMLWLYRLWRAIKMNPENRHYYEMYFFALLMFLPTSILPSSIIWEHHYWILFAIINEISHPDNWMPRQYEQI
ncbi:MAG TPA: O-antigen ligase family protein [Candidatus Cloacimonas acidaminovorans]|nr:O-antigen ligase family protein [Candidatus Cloacimonas acidaminovorans]